MLEVRAVADLLKRKTFKSQLNHFISFVFAHFEIILLVILIILAFIRWASPLPSGSGDSSYFTYPELASFRYFPLWDGRENLGSSDAFGLGYNFQFILDSLLSTLTGVGLAHRIVWYWLSLLISTPFVYLLAKSWFNSRIVSFGATLIYLVNSEFIQRAGAGHLALMYPYLLVPAIVYFLLRSIQTKKIFWLILAILPAAYSLIIDLRGFYASVFIILPISLVYFITSRETFISKILWYIKAGVIVIVCLVLLYLYSLVPSLLFEGPSLPSGYNDVFWLQTLSSMNLSNSMSLFQSHWPNPLTFDVFPIQPAFFIFPILAFIPLLTRRLDKRVIVLVIISLVGVFLTKGTNPPFGDLNIWLFQHIPGFWAFRDPDKFQILVCFGYSFLVPLGFDETLKFLNSNILRQRPTFRLFTNCIFMSVVLVIFIFLLKPVFFQEIGGNFNSFQLPQWQTTVEKSYEEDNNFYRSVWAPIPNAIVPKSPLHPAVSLSSLNDYYSQTRPIADLYEYYSNNKWAYLQSPTLHQFFDILGFRYVYMPQDYGTNLTVAIPDTNTVRDRETVQKYLSSVSWLKPAATTTSMPAYENPSAKSAFFASSQRAYFTGSDNIYSILAGLPGFDLSKLTMIPNDAQLSITPLNSQIQIFNGTNLDDLASHYIPARYITSLYKQLSPVVSVKNVWNAQQLIDPTSWSQIGQSEIKNADFDYGQGFIFASTRGKVTVKVSVPNSDNYQLWARTLDNQAGTNVEFDTFDEQNLSLQVLATTNTNFRWHQVGHLTLKGGTQDLTINSLGGFNAINLIALVPDSVFQSAQSQVEELLSQSKVVQLQNFNSSDFKRTSSISLVGNNTWDMVKTGSYTPQLHFSDENVPLNAYLIVDGHKFNLKQYLSQNTKSGWFTLPLMQLTKGKHQVSLQVVGYSDVNFIVNGLSPVANVILTYGDKSFSQLLSDDSNAPVITGEYLNPYKFVAHIQNATQPFDLVFNSSFDPNWTAQIQNTYYHPEEAYSMIQTYHIDKLGTYDVIVEFRPQKYVYLGLLLSGISLILVIIALYVSWLKKW